MKYTIIKILLFIPIGSSIQTLCAAHKEDALSDYYETIQTTEPLFKKRKLDISVEQFSSQEIQPYNLLTYQDVQTQFQFASDAALNLVKQVQALEVYQRVAPQIYNNFGGIMDNIVDNVNYAHTVVSSLSKQSNMIHIDNDDSFNYIIESWYDSYCVNKADPEISPHLPDEYDNQTQQNLTDNIKMCNQYKRSITKIINRCITQRVTNNVTIISHITNLCKIVHDGHDSCLNEVYWSFMEKSHLYKFNNLAPTTQTNFCEYFSALIGAFLKNKVAVSSFKNKNGKDSLEYAVESNNIQLLELFLILFRVHKELMCSYNTISGTYNYIYSHNSYNACVISILHDFLQEIPISSNYV